MEMKWQLVRGFRALKSTPK